MPAPDLKTVYNIASAFESGSKAILANNSLTRVNITGDKEITTTPYIEVKAGAISPLAHLHNYNGQYVFDTFQLNLTFGIVTDREVTNGNHSQYVSSILSIFRHQDVFNAGSILPYHQCMDLTFTKQSMVLEAEENGIVKDVSGMEYQLKVNIKADAWPV